MVQFDSLIQEIEPAWKAIRLRFTQTESAHIRILDSDRRRVRYAGFDAQ